MKTKIETINHTPLAQKSKQIFVGFSGGIDSTALLLILHKAFPHKVHAVHFQHGIRGHQAAQEAKWCQTFCQARSIAFTQIGLNVPAHHLSGESEEECARRLRLEQWQKIATAPHTLIALGHHHDDLIENFFLRLMRGSNSSGLTSLKEFTSFNSMNFWRPLLPFTKHQLQDFLSTEECTDCCTDESNQDPKYRRNRIRHQLIPKFNQIAGHSEGLSKSITILQQEARYLDQQAAKKLEELLQEESKLATWQTCPKALLPRILRLWHKVLTNQDFIFNHATIQRIHAELKRPVTFERTVPLAHHTHILINRTGLHLHHYSNQAEPQDTLNWNWQETPEINFGKYTLKAEVIDTLDIQPDSQSECFEASRLPPQLKVRSVNPGDRITPFGSNHPKKLKEIFINKKIARSQRRSIPLIIGDNQIIWATGVCRSHFAPLNSSTEKALKLTFELNQIPHPTEKQDRL